MITREDKKEIDSYLTMNFGRWEQQEVLLDKMLFGKGDKRYQSALKKYYLTRSLKMISHCKNLEQLGGFVNRARAGHGYTSSKQDILILNKKFIKAIYIRLKQLPFPRDIPRIFISLMLLYRIKPMKIIKQKQIVYKGFLRKKPVEIISERKVPKTKQELFREFARLL